MSTILIRFSDLFERKIVKNWPTLKRWVEREGFPPGKMIGPNTRAWTEEEVNEWLASRPDANATRGNQHNEEGQSDGSSSR
jgi:predicted DNA-binding transcriptional regulator AlpA